MDPLVTAVQTFARRYRLFQSGDAIIVGVSGGPDSLCLLHVLQQLSLQLTVAHLHHGLRGVDADADERFVADAARELGLPYIEGRADVRALAAREGWSLEEAARLARYAFLRDTAREAGACVIAVGHNADDQAETVLMHFLRGSGVDGLRGMLPRTPLADYRLISGEAEEASELSDTPLWLVRPLLQTDRDRIAGYCAAHGLQPRYDQSNEDTSFYRNRLRHELIPILKNYNPAIQEVLAHTAEALAGDAETLQGQTAQAWDAVALPGGPDEIIFDLESWRAASIGLQRALLREAVYRLRRSLRDLGWEHVERAVWLAREGETGQAATLTGGLALELGYDRLRIAPEDAPWSVAAPQIAEALPLTVPGVTPLPGGWRIVIEAADTSDARPGEGDDPWQAWLGAGATGPVLTLRPRQPGDRFQPQGMGGHSMKLNEYMINAKIPRDARAHWPLLVGRGGIAWVCGLRVDERAAVTPASTRVWRVTIERLYAAHDPAETRQGEARAPGPPVDFLRGD